MRSFIVYVFALAVVTSASAAPEARTLGPEHQRLNALCGTYDVEVTFYFKPAGPGVTSKGRSTIRPLFDGQFIEEKVEGTLNGAPFTTLSWTGYNPFLGKYEATRIASTNTIRLAETGSYDEATRQFELTCDYAFAGDTWHQRDVVRVLPGNTPHVESYMRYGKVPEWKGAVITYTRRAK